MVELPSLPFATPICRSVKNRINLGLDENVTMRLTWKKRCVIYRYVSMYVMNQDLYVYPLHYMIIKEKPCSIHPFLDSESSAVISSCGGGGKERRTAASRAERRTC